MTLPELVPRDVATELTLTGRVFDGAEAHVRPKHDRRDASAVLPVNVSDAHWRELEALNALDLELYAAISERHEAIAEACLGPRHARR